MEELIIIIIIETLSNKITTIVDIVFNTMEVKGKSKTIKRLKSLP